MKDDRKTATVLGVLIVAFLALAVAFHFNLWGRQAPLPDIPLVPTGGVNLETAAEFLKAGAAALGVGGELVQAAALKAGKPEIITQTAQKFLTIIRETREIIAASARK